MQDPAPRYLKQQQRDRDGALIPSSVAAAANAVAHVYNKPIGRAVLLDPKEGCPRVSPRDHTVFTLRSPRIDRAWFQLLQP